MNCDDRKKVTIQPIHIKTLIHIGKRNEYDLAKDSDERDESLASSWSMFFWFFDIVTGEWEELVGAIPVVSVEESKK